MSAVKADTAGSKSTSTATVALGQRNYYFDNVYLVVVVSMVVVVHKSSIVSI